MPYWRLFLEILQQLQAISVYIYNFLPWLRLWGGDRYIRNEVIAALVLLTFVFILCYLSFGA